LALSDEPGEESLLQRARPQKGTASREGVLLPGVFARGQIQIIGKKSQLRRKGEESPDQDDFCVSLRNKSFKKAKE